jgi:hypothetical protein
MYSLEEITIMAHATGSTGKATSIPQVQKQMPNGVKNDEDKIEVNEEKDKDEETEAKESEEKIPTGMLAESKPLYQKKDNDGKYQWSTTEPEDVEDAAESPETAKYAFLVRYKKRYGFPYN